MIRVSSLLSLEPENSLKFYVMHSSLANVEIRHDHRCWRMDDSYSSRTSTAAIYHRQQRILTRPPSPNEVAADGPRASAVGIAARYVLDSQGSHQCGLAWIYKESSDKLSSGLSSRCCGRSRHVCKRSAVASKNSNVDHVTWSSLRKIRIFKVSGRQFDCRRWRAFAFKLLK